MKRTKRIRQLEDRVDLLLEIVNDLLRQKEVVLIWADEWERLKRESGNSEGE